MKGKGSSATRKMILDYGVNHWGPKEADYDALLEGLELVRSMKLCDGCLKGGGNTECEIRACAKKKGLAECVDCGGERTCKNAKHIRSMRSGGQRVGMKVKRKAGDQSSTIEQWMDSIKI